MTQSLYPRYWCKACGHTWTEYTPPEICPRCKFPHSGEPRKIFH